MKTLFVAAVVAVAVAGCGGPTEEEEALVGVTASQLAGSELPPVAEGPVLLSTSELFAGTEKVRRDPNAPTFADQTRTTADVRGPCR